MYGTGTFSLATLLAVESYERTFNRVEGLRCTIIPTRIRKDDINHSTRHRISVITRIENRSVTNPENTNDRHTLGPAESILEMAFGVLDTRTPTKDDPILRRR